MYPSPPYPPYPSFPPPQQRLSFWQLRKLVKSFGSHQSWPEFYYQQAMRAEYLQRRFVLLPASLPR